MADAGGHGARYFCTDICDGEAQGHDGINYSLPSRDMMANMIEIHAGATPFDGAVYIASCDKSMPAHLMALGRINIPSIVVTGGVMDAGPDLLTLEQIGKYSAMYERGEITKEEMDYYKHNACPSCGACSFMGTASTMQIMAEALGLMLPGSALMPATSRDLREVACKAGKQAVWLAEHDLTPDKIVTMESFENAIMVHAAISGSTNSLLHIPAIAREFGFDLDADTFDRLHRGAHYLLNIRPAGEWPAQFFYYAGGVPRIMEEIRDMLHLDVMTVTGKTLGENLEELKKNGFYEKCQGYLDQWNLKREDVIRPAGEDAAPSVANGFRRFSGTSEPLVISNAEAAYVPYTPRSFAYCSDTAPFPELSGWVKGVDLLYHEATFSDEYSEMAEKTHHSTARQAAECALAAGAGKLLIGHYSSRFSDLGILLKEACEVFPATELAQEGMVIEVPLQKF